MARKASRAQAPAIQSTAAWRKGWDRGYQLGNGYGYHFGRCEAVIRQMNPAPLGWWNIRVLYITSGKGFPYSPLDQSIIEALKGLVRELVILTPMQDFTSAARKLRPDYVLVLDGLNVSVEEIDKVRAEGIRTAIWLTDDPYYTDITVNMVTHYNYVFTLELECVAFYQRAGVGQTHYLPFGANASVFRPKMIPIQYRKEISFIGSGYWNRIAVFDRIAPYLAARNTYISGIWWDRLRQYKLLSSRIQLNKWMGAEETSSFYNGSRIVINMHRAHDDKNFNNNSQGIQAVSPNPRTFEIAGCGTLQLTDVRSDLLRFYTPDVEIVTYASAEELVHKLDYYLHHEEERRAIALNALRRTFGEHTYAHRLSQMLRLVFG
ncbi:CgeB family protein [Paenibacillus rigui]|uniref:Spore maturation protein cgeB n=1 Tax=Paenibacillus rigui TaxID=554312 RepID=A0A229UKP2_9BACL|nr:glycosyltransferase [Paenibacillus rigui]OXM83479.1 spore maturation protein cgeB [Paenibacillus rigui]